MKEEMAMLLERHGVKPTANRLLVAGALRRSRNPLSLLEIEARLGTVDRSSISRVLALFREHHVVHALDDGGNGVRYELCLSHDDDRDDDLHVHFFCLSCGRTFCLDDVPLPPVAVPEGYEVTSAAYVLKGICPECRK